MQGWIARHGGPIFSYVWERVEGVSPMRRLIFVLLIVYCSNSAAAAGGEELKITKGASQLLYLHDGQNMMAGTPEPTVLELAEALDEYPFYVLTRHMLFWGETDLASKFLDRRLRKKKDLAFSFGDLSYGETHAFAYLCYAYAIKSDYCWIITTDFVRQAFTKSRISQAIYPFYIFSSHPRGDRTILEEDKSAIARTCTFISRRQRLIGDFFGCQNLLVAEQVKAMYRKNCTLVLSTAVDLDDFYEPSTMEIGDAVYTTCRQNKNTKFFEEKLSEMGYDRFLKVGSKDYLEMVVRILYWG